MILSDRQDTVARAVQHKAATAVVFEPRPNGEAEPRVPCAPRPFSFLPVAKFRQGTSPAWFIKGILPRAELGIIYGQPKTGKSFFSLDIVMSLVLRKEWCHGRRCKGASVAYVVAEGGTGFRARLDAYKKHFKIRDEQLDGLQLLDAAPNLLDCHHVNALIAELKALDIRPALIVVDTLAQVTPGANENSSEDMGKALAACRRIFKETGAMVLLIAHSGKDPNRGIRGWSGILGALDVEILVERVEPSGSHKAIINRLKDGRGEGDRYAFSLHEVTLGCDEDGDEVTSCVVVGGQADQPSNGSSDKAIADQVWCLIDSELHEDRLHSQNSLQDVAEKIPNLSRAEVRRAVRVLRERGRIADWWRPGWEEMTPSKQHYLHPIGTDAPAAKYGVPTTAQTAPLTAPAKVAKTA